MILWLSRFMCFTLFMRDSSFLGLSFGAWLLRFAILPGLLGLFRDRLWLNLFGWRKINKNRSDVPIRYNFLLRIKWAPSHGDSTSEAEASWADDQLEEGSEIGFLNLTDGALSGSLELELDFLAAETSLESSLASRAEGLESLSILWAKALLILFWMGWTLDWFTKKVSWIPKGTF